MFLPLSVRPVMGAREGTSVTTLDEADRKARLERARETGLFRYSLVQELAEPGLTAPERGRRAGRAAGHCVAGDAGPVAAGV